jgi:hypothetical protein
MTRRVWCVQWRESWQPDASTEWCATFRGAKPSEDAAVDATACGMTVAMRIGSEKRVPTCEECRRIVARRKGAARGER